ncbi:type IV pilus biogenesis protein PilP [Paraburkholderia humisilvae]|uniref:Type IV pilus biogenesis protein PilP n=1 Tax=Paraburkholderia humisilvae TaxID=627669 RepID=A0A6J5F001_9BURK|nr:type IV pilus biogenesis protein PilP [Paraburkholderia humisilvae]CAB3772180.1 hypothetical protein LMG29542_06813 [Paraburkholderia humisilvae]
MRSDRVVQASVVLMVACSAVFAANARAQSVPSTPAAGGAPAGVAAAVPAPAPAASAAANELMQLQQDTVVLKAQLKKLDAQAQVAEREAALSRMGRTITYDEVAVRATQSLGNSISATVEFNGAGEFDVHQGDTLPNEMRVIAIHPGSVVMQSKDGRRTTLAVMSTRSPLSRIASAGLNGGEPPLPTLLAPTR